MTFDEFHRARRRHALLYARAILGSDAAEDACQEAWLRAWKAWDTSQPNKREAWLLRIVRNCCIDRLRSERTTPGLTEADLEAAPNFEEDVIAAVDAGAVGEMLAELAPQLREVLWLREVIDLSYAEIAEVQSVPVGTVMSRLHSARAKAAKLLRAKGAW